MSTDFASLGYDPATIIADLQALGIEVYDDAGDPIYTDGELESLAFVTNIVVLDAISSKSDSIEELLAAYEIETDKLSGMQEFLNNIRDYMTPEDATKGDLIEFLEKEEVFFGDLDPANVALDVTYSVKYAGYPATLSLETLQDLLDLIDSGAGIEYDDVSGTVPFTTFFINLFDDVSGDDGLAFGGASINGVSYVKVNVGDRTNPLYMTYDDFDNYVIGMFLQEAGYLSDDVKLYPSQFAELDPDSTYGSDQAAEWIQLYAGKYIVERDTDAGTLSLSVNGSAGLRQMGVEIDEYSQDSGDQSNSGFPEPLKSEEDTAFFRLTGYYAFGHREDAWAWGGVDTYDKAWSEYADDDLNDDFSSDDLDVLLEAAATAIESQSTSTEVALLYTNSAITEWGELNDVWDLIHQYVHDALQRASNNSA